jgi:MFS family permease
MLFLLRQYKSANEFWMLAVANNIATMLVSRFLDGLAGSAFLSVAGGSVGDMFPRERLQAPMMVYTASPFIGPGTNHLHPHTLLSISDS